MAQWTFLPNSILGIQYPDNKNFCKNVDYVCFALRF